MSNNQTNQYENRKNIRETVEQSQTVSKKNKKLIIFLTVLAIVFASVLAYLFYSANQKSSKNEPSEVVYTIDEQKFSLADFNFQRYLSRQSLFNKTEFVSDNELEAKLDSGESVSQIYEVDIIDGLKMETAVFGLAEKYQVKLSSDDKTNLEAQKANFIAGFKDKKAYKTFLTTENTTEAAIVKYLEALKLKDLLLEKAFSEDGKADLTTGEKTKAKQDYLQKYVKIKYVFLSLVDEAANPLSDDKKAEKLAIAESIVLNEEEREFDEYIVEFSEDQTELGTNGDYVFKDEKNQLSQAAFALSVDQISEVLNFDDSIMVIQRLELDEAKLPDYENILRTEKMDQTLSELMASFKVKKGSAVEKIEIK